MARENALGVRRTAPVDGRLSCFTCGLGRRGGGGGGVGGRSGNAAARRRTEDRRDADRAYGVVVVRMAVVAAVAMVVGTKGRCMCVVTVPVGPAEPGLVSAPPRDVSDVPDVPSRGSRRVPVGPVGPAPPGYLLRGIAPNGPVPGPGPGPTPSPGMGAGTGLAFRGSGGLRGDGSRILTLMSRSDRWHTTHITPFLRALTRTNTNSPAPVPDLGRCTRS